jgi:[acyl-carrier-protein] S-malonyltransferase
MSKRALFFPGQGAHSVGMGQSLYDSYESVRVLYEQAEELVDFDLKRLSFEGPEQELRRTDVSQPAIVVASLAALTALKEELGGDIPGVVATCGMSLGEYTALAYAEVLSLEDVLKLVTLRGRFMQECCEATPSGMTTVLGLGIEAVEKTIEESGLGDKVGVANDNSPKQVVLSGESEALQAVAARAKEAGARRLFPLKVAGAYHSALMTDAGEKLKVELEKVTFHEPKVTVLANIDTAAYSADTASDKLVKQVSGTVRWRESMTLLKALEVDSALELGPGGVLKGLMKKNDRSISCLSAMTASEVKAAAQAWAG